MQISTKGRYALRLMLDLAVHNTGELVKIKDIAAREDISEKYLEAIVASLSKNGFVRSLRGKGGGYQLLKDPSEYTIGSILRLTEGSLAPIACLEHEPNQCERVSVCKTLKMWEGAYKVITEYFDGITIADLLADTTDVGNYII